MHVLNSSSAKTGDGERREVGGWGMGAGGLTGREYNNDSKQSERMSVNEAMLRNRCIPGLVGGRFVSGPSSSWKSL